MAKLHAPFNFVPLPTRVFFPSWENQISHDIPFEDGESGVIELKITNLSPLFTRNGSTRENEDVFSSHIDCQGQKKYFIPSTTLKGCFRCIMEILSFAKIGKFNNSSFGMPREFDTKKSTNSYYTDVMKNVVCGWLQYDDDLEKYVFYRCKKGVQTITHKSIKALFSKFNPGQNHKTAYIKQHSIEKDCEFFHIYNDESGEEYRIVCTGYMNKKSIEYLFSIDTHDGVIVDDSVFTAFDTVHQRTPYYYGKDKRDKQCLRYMLMEEGKRIPVFAHLDNNRQILAIGITRYFKYPYKNNIERCIRNSSEDNFINKRDLPEVIFGYIDGRNSLKGRVSFGHAFCEQTVNDGQLISVSGVLGQPSASFYPFYIQQNVKGKYLTYQDNVCVAGRKKYRIYKGQTLGLPQGNNNENVKNTFYALPKGLTFTSRIVVHNLRKAEIGALLSSLTLNHTEGCYLNLGLAKSFGYGKISTEIKLNGFNFTEAEYCKTFENELLRYNNLNITQQWNALAAICSEHSPEELKMMELKEYTEAKKNTNYETLAEAPKSLCRYFSEEEINSILRAAEQERKDARKKEEEKLIQEELERQKQQEEMNTREEESRKVQEEERIREFINNGLKPLLEATNTFGKYKVEKFSQCANNVESWLKKSKNSALPQEQHQSLLECLSRLFKSQDKKEKKDWLNFESRIWKQVANWVGENIAHNWFNRIVHAK